MKVTTPRQLFVAAMMLAGILAGGVGTAAAQAPKPQAVNLRLFNSGLLDDGSPAPGGTPDPHFTLISAPPSATGTKLVAVVALSSSGFAPNTANSFWIGPDKNLATNQPVGNYDYQTTIDLTGLDPATASITGNVAADDSVTIFLNGVKKATIPLPAWGALVPFTISGDFVPGINKLDFAVPNTNGPTGLHVQLSGTAAGASTAVAVSAQQPWVDTGVDLKAGDALTISATGQWTNGGNPPVFIGPDGYVGFRLPDATLGSANFASLIGKVGDQVFFVGSAYKGTSPGTGRLYLQINDLANSFADNSGKLDVVVKRNQ